ncbi:MAG: transcription antitermination factor NusB [Omnitrophica bacterium GWA2_52_8]|nr:MAG: transcription antitermination factor NusB [Omnitrophica bacterium GWA2_52_8]
MRKRSVARECALQILYQFEMNDQLLEEAKSAFWQESPPASEEIRTFAELLVNGTISHIKEIDQAIVKAAKNWLIHRMASIDRNILRFATYELLFLKDVPPKVTINEAVNIAKKYSQEDSGKFVNGILDNITHAIDKPIES